MSNSSMYFYNSWQECLQEIERWRNLPRRLIGVSALTRKTGHTEITSFHFNVACALLKSIFELQIKCGDFFYQIRCSLRFYEASSNYAVLSLYSAMLEIEPIKLKPHKSELQLIISIRQRYIIGGRRLSVQQSAELTAKLIKLFPEPAAVTTVQLPEDKE